MTVKCLPDNVFISRSSSIILQVSVVFIFLTSFYFVYVINVEKRAFAAQLNFIVDDLFKDIDINKVIPSEVDSKYSDILINGILDYQSKKVQNSLISANKEAEIHNKAIIKLALQSLILVVGLIIIITLGIITLGYCIPFQFHLKEAIYAVLIVALVELTFLITVTLRYISANPNDVKLKIAEVIHNYIKNREK